uniref:VIT domain-containing protein n=1 Tax=Corethron hystrix TaxID=216773 RepID=A0A7S1BSN3_9STRA|mmetsp:Transcript_3798/g.7077  ORF Transcript_3798/g.7077 Transcript_3798/m.7077 type:complete len:634 (+) Transcript_3798:263-2164(+)
MKISANIIDGIAEVSIFQEFETVSWDLPFVDSRYQLPIDERASVTKFSATIGDRVVRAVVKEKEEAQREYDAALENGNSAFLAEQERRDIFKISVGNLPQENIVRIEFVYVSPLETIGAEIISFFLPTGIAPKYEPTNRPQDTLSYDVDLMDKGVTIEVNATMAMPLTNVTSPSHTIEVTSNSEKSFANVVLVDENPLTRDLVIYFNTENSFKPQLFIEESDLYSSTAMLLSFVPPPLLREEIKKYEFIFIVDQSGSMGGDKMMQTKKALVSVIESLPDGSLFNIVGFGSTCEFLFPESRSIESRQIALSHIDKMEASLGGTEILLPLQKIYATKPTETYYRQLYLFTDGEVSNEDETIEYVRKFRSTGRVFSLGIGPHASRYLVQGIAKSGRGTAEFVPGNDDELIYEAVKRQMDVSMSPVLDDAEIEWGVEGQQAPYITPPLLQGKRYIAYFLYEGSSASDSLNNFNNLLVTSDIFVSVTAYDITTNKKYVFDAMTKDMIMLRGSYSDNMIHKMAARALISDLEDGGSKMQETEANYDEIRNKIVEIGLKYQLPSSETSFIAVDNYDWKGNIEMKQNDDDMTLLSSPKTYTADFDDGPYFSEDSSAPSSCLCLFSFYWCYVVMFLSFLFLV